MDLDELQPGTIYMITDRQPHLLLTTAAYQEPWTDGRTYHAPLGPLEDLDPVAQALALLDDWLSVGPLALEGPFGVVVQVDPAALLARVGADDFNPSTDLPEGTDLRVFNQVALDSIEAWT